MKTEKEKRKSLEQGKKEFETLSDQTRAILLGLLLGDGSLKIQAGYKNARLSFRHSITQEEYYKWKREKLKAELSTDKDMWYQESTNSDEFGKRKWRYQSGARPSLTYLYELTHKGKSELVIRRTWLNKMTALSLAVWWCDDGSLVGNASQGVFSTDGFKEGDVKVLDQYMKKVWGITTEARLHGLKRADGGERYRLWIKTHEDLKKFLRIIMPELPTKTMLKKVLLLYKDTEHQERWISEIVRQTKQPREIVEAECYARKQELKEFRSENDIVHSDKKEKKEKERRTLVVLAVNDETEMQKSV